MTSSLKTALLLVAATFAAPLSGCYVRAEIEPLVRYEGNTVSDSVAYSAGVPVRILSANGNVTVVPGGTDEVEVAFSPFALGEEGADENAKREMEELLDITFGGAGEIVIQVSKKDGASSGLGADIEVRLPAAFDSNFEVIQNNGGVDVDLSGTGALSTSIHSENGSVDVQGARGRLDIATDNGSVDVDVDAWSNQDGAVRTSNGDLEFSLPADVNGALTADATVEVIEQGIPSTWTSAGASPDRSFTMGSGAGGQVDLATGNGSITITAR